MSNVRSHHTPYAQSASRIHDCSRWSAVSRPWKGYGSAIFLELGRLTEEPGVHRGIVTGEACIAIEWDWRLELDAAIVCGSSDSRPVIHEGLKSLRDAAIASIEIEGRVPELVVRMSTGHILRSMAMLRGDPRWSIKARDGGWLNSKAGSLSTDFAAEDRSESEVAAFSLAAETASRWGTVVSEQRLGLCADCQFYVALDGNGHLLDYGCCASENSPFDGRAVYRQNGCTAFSPASET